MSGTGFTSRTLPLEETLLAIDKLLGDANIQTTPCDAHHARDTLHKAAERVASGTAPVICSLGFQRRPPFGSTVLVLEHPDRTEGFFGLFSKAPLSHFRTTPNATQEHVMSLRSVLKRSESIKSAAESDTHCTIPRRPDPISIAFCVAWSREMKQLSIQALASMSGVSPSSIERIERGERVSDDTLQKVAVAVNQDEDAFTGERIPLSQDEVGTGAPGVGGTV